MGMLQTMKSFLPKPAQPVHPDLAFDDTGFSSNGKPSWRAAWSEVRRITAYKIDLFTVDEIRVEFALQSGDALVIAEESPGFEALMLELVQRFPSATGWHGKVVQPAFASRVTVLYECAN